MIVALWSLCRALVWVLFITCWMLAAHFRRRYDGARATHASPDSSMWEQMQAEHREKQIGRKLIRWEGRTESLRGAGKWLCSLRKGRLSYPAAICDAATPWVFWALERSGTFDLWTWAIGVWEMLPWA